MQNPLGIPRWVMQISSAPGGRQGGDLVVNVRVRCRPWRLRLWLAWRLLTAPIRKDDDA